MTSPHARNAGIIGNLNSTRFESADQPVIVEAPQRRMRLLRRTKIRFHAKMNLHWPALEPAPTALGQLRRLRNFPHPEQIP